MDFVIETKELLRRKNSQGRTLINQYTFLHTLGSGSFGKVKLCFLGETFYAAKIFNKASLKKKRDIFKKKKNGIQSALDDVKREIAIMKLLSHDNVLKLYEVIDDDEDDSLYMVIEYCSKGAIMDWDSTEQKFVFPWKTKLSDSQLRKFVRDMVCGLDYLHSLKIIHRDIKPQNLLIDSNWVVKIADFGQSLIFDESDEIRNSVGTYQFFAPECCSSGHYSGKAADIWAMGLTIYVMVFSKLPFEAEFVEELFEVIQTFQLEFPSPIDQSLRNLIERMLDKDPDTRIKMSDILQHEWVLRDSQAIAAASPSKINPTPSQISNAICNMVKVRRYGKRWIDIIRRNRDKK